MKCNPPRPGFELVSPFLFPTTITITLYIYDSVGEANDVLLWTPSHRSASVGRPINIYGQQLYTDTECSLKDQLKVMVDRDGWRERVRETSASSVIWWWWWWHIYIFLTNWELRYPIAQNFNKQKLIHVR